MSDTPLSIVLLGGEGIGPEVVEAAAAVLAHLLPDARFVRPPHGAAAMAEFGTPLPASTKEACQAADAILFGAIQTHAREVLRYLRWGLVTYANLRPTRSLPGIPSALRRERPVDLLIVRENLEGEYPAREGEMAELVACARPPPSTRRSGAYARVDYAQVVKDFGSVTGEEAQRYSPPRLIGQEKITVSGTPDEDRVCTSHLERANWTLRDHLRRFTRLSNGFSRKKETGGDHSEAVVSGGASDGSTNGLENGSSGKDIVPWLTGCGP